MSKAFIPSDVSALVLSIGEPYVERAIESVRKQTLPAAEIVRVDGVSPVSRALNEGVSRIRTEFFVEVDADMVLFPRCFEDLRAGADSRDVGIVWGALIDPLMGPTSGVKLYRTEYARETGFPETLSPDTDYQHTLAKRGIASRVRLSDPRPEEARPVWHAFGLHEPEYSHAYVFRKYEVLGRRYRYRDHRTMYVHRLERLRLSGSKTALTARVAMAHGLFLPAEGDMLRPAAQSVESAWLEKFLGQASGSEASPTSEPEGFASAFELGRELRETADLDRFLAVVSELDRLPAERRWRETTGLFHALLAAPDAERPEQPWSR